MSLTNIWKKNFCAGGDEEKPMLLSQQQSTEFPRSRIISFTLSTSANR
jgi:hypothetical protein